MVTFRHSPRQQDNPLSYQSTQVSFRHQGDTLLTNPPLHSGRNSRAKKEILKNGEIPYGLRVARKRLAQRAEGRVRKCGERKKVEGREEDGKIWRLF